MPERVNNAIMSVLSEEETFYKGILCNEWIVVSVEQNHGNIKRVLLKWHLINIFQTLK